DFILRELEVEVFIKSGFIVNITKKVPSKLATLYDDFKASPYYMQGMEIIDEKENYLTISCITNKKCKLCKVIHKSGSGCLKVMNSGNFVFFCHASKITFKKSLKGKELLRNNQKLAIDNSIQQFFTLNLKDVDMIKEHSKFLGCDESGEVVYRKEYNNKYLILNAHMGKGKTSFISTILKVKDVKRMLFVSQRKTFTNFICSEFSQFGIVNYLDIKGGNYNVDKLCIQAESLHKLTNTNFDVVIIDEVETVLNQFSSSTMVYVRDCWRVFTECIRQSSQCILADAFVLNRTLDFVRGVCEGEEITMLSNESTYLQGRKCIQVSQDLLNVAVIDALNKDKRVVYISSSREDLTRLERQIRDACPTKKLKVYDRDSDKNDLKNVNEIWSECDFVGYTPVIQTGVSYMGKPFDLCYANLKRSNLSRDAMQMMMRCRVLNDNTVYFSLSKRQIYNTSGIEMFDNYSIFEGERYDKTHMLIDELNKNQDKNKEMIDMLEKSLKTTDKVLLRVMWHNLREHMLSQCHYNSMCISLLKMQGYDVHLLSENDYNKDSVKVDLNLDYVDDYLNIADIDGDEVEKLRYDDTNKENRMKIDKYFFEHMTVADLDVEMKSKLFFEYYQVSHKKRFLKNIKYEKSEISDCDLIDNDFIKSDMLINKMQMIGKKRQYIR
ncbi:MAG: hypothetical protein EOO43_11225, partial [Flavobacterium sp.]